MLSSRTFRILTILLAVLFLNACKIIEEGNVGIKKTFGKVHEETLSPGVHLYAPGIHVIEPWDIKTQTRQNQLDLPSQEGLIVRLETAVLFRPTDVISLKKKVGSRFVKKVLEPKLINVFREVVGKQKVDEIINNPNMLTTAAKKNLKAILEPEGILVEDLLVTDLGLPGNFKESIEKKLQAEQKALQKTFELDQAKKDAEIEIARARGAAEAQEIVKKTLSQEYLQYLWISTLNDNPNVIYVSTEANMPIFRTTEEPKAKKPVPAKK